jgi:hypothetical protein
MESRDRDLARRIAALRREQLRRALAHLGRRLVGERDRGDRLGREAALDQVRDLRRDHARLPAAGAGEHQERPVDMTNGFALLRVERMRHRGLEAEALLESASL